MECMIPHARDYRWFEGGFASLADSYCVTLVAGLGPHEVLARLGGVRVGVFTGAEALVAPAFDLWVQSDGTRLFVGLADLGAWTLMVEPHGHMGVTDAYAVPLSRGTTLVAHRRTATGADRFVWLRDGVRVLDLEPSAPHRRSGTDATAAGLDDVLDQVGLGADGAAGTGPGAAFALAEYVTGVEVGAQVLMAARFVAGGVTARA